MLNPIFSILVFLELEPACVETSAGKLKLALLTLPFFKNNYYSGFT